MQEAIHSDSGESQPLSAKLENLRQEIERLVVQGVESSRIELTRQCLLGNAELKSRVNFAKTIQGLANSYPAEERVYVVGADQRERKFFSLINEREYDPANLRGLLDRYLEPVPNFEACLLEAADKSKYAAIILAAVQPRPILVKVDVQDSGGKAHLCQKGEIWVKKQTALVRANRDDLERIYETRIESESERRAQMRFASTRNLLEASLRLQTSQERRIPSADLVFGPDSEFRAYIELLHANQDTTRFQMLLTVLRDLLIERWHPASAFDPEAPRQSQSHNEKLNLHFQNTFEPALRRTIHTGLLDLKYGITDNWFGGLVDLLAETFEACKRLEGLPPIGFVIPGETLTRRSLGLEVAIAARLLATYAIRMRRDEHLSALLKKWVLPLVIAPGRTREPFLFWPSHQSVPSHNRIAYAWEHSAQPYWLEFFGSEDSFLDAACQLEFVLHMNSYLATRNDAAQSWLQKYRPDLNLEYWYHSDLWRYPLDPVIPLAERFYSELDMGPNASILYELSVEAQVLREAFFPNQITGTERPSFAQYLRDLQTWQGMAAMNARIFRLEPDWGPDLGPPVKAATARPVQ